MPLLAIGHARYWRSSGGAPSSGASRPAHYPAWQASVTVTVISVAFLLVVIYGL